MEIGNYILKRPVRVPSFEGVYTIKQGTKVEVIKIEGEIVTVDFKDGYIDTFSICWCKTFLSENINEQ